LFRLRTIAALFLSVTLFLPPSPVQVLSDAVAADLVPLPAVRDSDDRWGIDHVDGSAVSQQLALNAGAHWNRWEFRWADIETTRGRFDWSTTDAMITASNNSGLRVQGILISMPDWATDSRTHLPTGLNLPWNDPGNLWARFVRETATRYGGRIRYWEIWNEEDDPNTFWAGSTADYYQMLKVSYLAIRSVDRTAQVAMGGLAYWPNPNFLDDILRLMVADPTAKANNFYFDILAWHTYSRPSDIYERVTQSRQKLASTIGVKPIWVNETNVPAWDESPMNNFRPYPWSASVTEQASYVIQAAAYSIAAGVDRFLVYRFQDTEWPEAYGLVRDVGTIRPEYIAYQVATRAFSKATSGVIARQGDTEQIVMQKPGQRVIVAWNRSATSRTALLGAAATSATAVDQTGATQQLHTTAGQYQVDLAGATDNNGTDATDYIVGGAPIIITETVPDGQQTIEEFSPLIGYAGAWDTVTTSGPSGGVARRTASAGLGAAIEFDGPSVTWVTSKGPDRGIARVDVDGVTQGTIDLYSATPLWNVPLTFGDFPPGRHRLVITVLGQHAAASTGSFVDVDQFVAEALAATLPPPTPTPSPTPSPTITPTATPTTAPTIGPTSTPTAPTPVRAQAASYVGVDAPSGHVALPILMRNWYGWTTLVSVANTSESSSSATLRFLDDAGRTSGRYSLSLPPHGSQIVDPGAVPGLVDGYAGAGVIDSAQPIVASVTEVSSDANALAYSGVAAGSEHVFIPLLFKRYNGWETSVQLQNLRPDPVSVDYTYRQSNGDGGPWTGTLIIAGQASLTLIQSLDPNLPDGYVGSLQVDVAPGGSIAALVSESRDGGNGASYDGALGGSVVLSAPLLFKNANGWDTGIQVQNVGDTTADVLITYFASDGGGTWVDRGAVEPGQSATFYQPANADLPNGFVGSAIISSIGDQPLVAIVNQVNTMRDVAMTYRAFGAGATSVAAPNLARDSGGWNAGVQVQNLGTGSSDVTLDLRAPDGTSAGAVTQTIAAGASGTFYLPALDALPAGWQGWGMVTSTPPEPLGVIVNLTRY